MCRNRTTPATQSFHLPRLAVDDRLAIAAMAATQFEDAVTWAASVRENAALDAFDELARSKSKGLNDLVRALLHVGEAVVATSLKHGSSQSRAVQPMASPRRRGMMESQVADFLRAHGTKTAPSGYEAFVSLYNEYVDYCTHVRSGRQPLELDENSLDGSVHGQRRGSPRILGESPRSFGEQPAPDQRVLNMAQSSITARASSNLSPNARRSLGDRSAAPAPQRAGGARGGLSSLGGGMTEIYATADAPELSSSQESFERRRRKSIPNNELSNGAASPPKEESPSVST